MRRLTEKQSKFENESQMEPSAQKSRSDNMITNIAALDNDTIVEAFKYLNYCQLAKTSLVSMRFSNLICTHRHKLARIYVDSIGMSEDNRDHTGIKFFDKTLSPEEYNNWVTCNQYTKKIPLETRIAGMQSTQYEHKIQPHHSKEKSVFDVRTELNHENWPVFQHFFRLFTDPCIYIRSIILPRRNDALKLLAGAINPDCGRIQCQSLEVSLEDNMQNRISWIKGHMHCYHFSIMGSPIVLPSNHDEEFLDFFMTGENCASIIYLKFYEPCKLIARFVQKFMDLKDCDENKVVGTIVCLPFVNVNIDVFKHDFADFVVERNISKTSRLSNLVFEFVNNDIGKKLRLCIRINFDYRMTEFTLTIASL